MKIDCSNEWWLARLEKHLSIVVLTVERSVMNSEKNSEEEQDILLPGRFVWTDEDIEVIAPPLENERHE